MTALFEQPERDEFKSESPIRAFTTFKIQGRYAIGKGFRPSLQHLVPYLDAMDRKEDWRLLQILEAATGTPSFVFRKEDPREEPYVPSAFRPEVFDPIQRRMGAAAKADAEMSDKAGVRCRDPKCPQANGPIHFHIPNTVFQVKGRDPETAHYSEGWWTPAGCWSELRSAMEHMNFHELKRFLDAEKVENISQYWDVASVASVLRLVEHLGWQDRISVTASAPGKIDPAKEQALEDTGIHRFLGMHPALGEPYTPTIKDLYDSSELTSDFYEAFAADLRDKPAIRPVEPSFKSVYRDEPDWRQHGSDTPIPDDRYMEAAEFVIRRARADTPQYLDSIIRDFKKRFGPPKNHSQIGRTSLAKQLHFLLGDKPGMLRIKQLIDGFRQYAFISDDPAPTDPREQTLENFRKRTVQVDGVQVPLIYPDDPVNPKHYNGRECADIGERLSANGYQVLKYCWRLGKKDDPCVELGKAIWYGESESELLREYARAQGFRKLRPNLTAIKNPSAFLEDRIADQPTFTQNIARMLWQGYGQRELRAIIEAINEHRFHMDCGRGLAV